MNQIVCPNCKYLVAYTQFCGHCATRLPQMPYAQQAGAQRASNAQGEHESYGIVERWKGFSLATKISLLVSGFMVYWQLEAP